MKTIHRVRFKEIGEAGDEKLKGHTVTVVGLGSVGAAIAEMLAREDFNLRLVDRGRVEEEDMGRLHLFHEEDITRFKVKQAKKRLEEINPRVKVKSFHEDLAESNIFLIDSELVIDCTNQTETNEMITKHCQTKKIPMIRIRYSGSKVKIVVAVKKLPQKHFKWSMDVGNITDEGVYAATTMLGAAVGINRVFKYFLGDKGNYHVEGDVWNFLYKSKKL